MTASYITIVIFMLFSAFFSGSEIAYASINKLRLKKSAEEGRKIDKLTYYVADHYDDALPAILLGNNLVNIAASSASTLLAIQITGGEQGIALATAIITVLIIIFGEIVPKIAAKEVNDKFARFAAYPIRFIMFITYPVIKLVKWMQKGILRICGNRSENASSMTEDELVTIIEMVEDEGVIDEERSELLQSAIEFSDISAQEIITPRVDMLAVDIDDSFDEILETVNSSPYSRIPVYKDTVDNIIGVLYINHLYKEMLTPDDFDLKSILMDVCYIPKTLKLPFVLSELKRRQQHLAVVTDEYGGTLGILTMEDVLEQLVGEIWDETDVVVKEIEKLDDGSFAASGDMSIYDFLEAMDIDDGDYEGEYTTVGGWVTEMLGNFPKEGDSFDYFTLHITVDKVEDKRVIRVIARKEEEE